MREIFRPFLYWHLFHIFETDIRRATPKSYEKESLDVKIFAGREGLDSIGEDLLSMGELPASEIAGRFSRGDAVAVAYLDNEPSGYMWMAFSSGAELALGAKWILASNEAVRYGSFVRTKWRGRGIHSFLNLAINRYAQSRGVVRTFASISALNVQSLSLPKQNRRAKAMSVILVRVRGLNYTYAKGIGMQFESRFSKPERGERSFNPFWNLLR